MILLPRPRHVPPLSCHGLIFLQMLPLFLAGVLFYRALPKRGEGGEAAGFTYTSSVVIWRRRVFFQATEEKLVGGLASESWMGSFNGKGRSCTRLSLLSWASLGGSKFPAATTTTNHHYTLLKVVYAYMYIVQWLHFSSNCNCYNWPLGGHSHFFTFIKKRSLSRLSQFSLISLKGSCARMGTAFFFFSCKRHGGRKEVSPSPTDGKWVPQETRKQARWSSWPHQDQLCSSQKLASQPLLCSILPITQMKFALANICF